MVSLIQVGSPVKLKEAKGLAKKEQAEFAMNKSRFGAALPTVKQNAASR